MAKGDVITVLIVDDVPDTRDNLRKLLYFERDIQVVGEAGRAEEGIQKARELRPSVVLMDINLPGIDGITATETIRAQLPATQVIVMSVQGESEYLRRAMLAGAREFLVKPFGSEELANSIRRVNGLARDGTSPMPVVQQTVPVPLAEESTGPGKIVSIFSAKGGVGRTTLACNLATALKVMTDRRIALVDGSLQFGDVGVVLNIQASKTIVDLVPHLGNLEPEMLEGILAAHSSGVRVLMAPPRPEVAELVTADAMKQVLVKLRERYDYVIVDTWPTFQDTVLAALDLSDKIILLFTMEMPAIKNVKLFLEVADALDYPPDKLLLAINRSDSSGGIRISDLEESLRRKIPIKIVSDGRLATYALNRGVPFVISNPEAALSKDIFSIAKLVSGVGSASFGTDHKDESRKTVLGPLRRLIASLKPGAKGRGAAASAP